MPNNFINYINGELKLSEYRHVCAYFGDISDILEALRFQDNEIFTCPLEGARELLDDPEYLANVACSVETINKLKAFIDENT